MPMFFSNSRQRQLYHFAAQPRVSESSWAGWAPQPALRAGSQLGSLGCDSLSCDCFARPTLGGIEEDVAAYYGVTGKTSAERAASAGAAKFAADCSKLGFSKAKYGTSYDDMCIGYMAENKIGAFAPKPPSASERPSWVMPVAIGAGIFALIFAATDR